jgi:hypothetical protein
VHFTDYSPDRKSPLERTLRSALNEAEAMLIADALIVENIKKGWEEITTPTSTSLNQPAKKQAGKKSAT